MVSTPCVFLRKLGLLPPVRGKDTRDGWWKLDWVEAGLIYPSTQDYPGETGDSLET